MNRLLILFFIAFSLNANAENHRFSRSLISDTLVKGAKAVIRESLVELDIDSPSSAVIKIKYVITILNDSGYDLSVFNEYYDKFSNIKRLNGKIYNSLGEVVKKITYSDFQDYSAISGYSLFESTRVVHFDPEYREYPFTIEYSFEKNYSALISIPYWTPYNDYDVSVEKSIFSVKSSPLANLKFLTNNFDSNSISAKTFDDKLIWNVENLSALKFEPMSPPVQEFIPMVAISPTKFVVDRIEGSTETWRDFGSWIRRLNEGLLTLPSERAEYFKELASKGGTIKEKIAILYEYLQSNTRYVSIQLGIGGWKPEPAASTDKVGYGDCKALTVYMQSILASVGIKSYYSIIQSGEAGGEIFNEFPSNQFNHAILCIPLEQDTLWLETTSQRIPAGYLGSFTDDREALVIFDDDAKLVRTSSLNCNEMKMKADVSLTASSAEISLKMEFYDFYYDKIASLINAEYQVQKKYVENKFSVPHILLSNFQIRGEEKNSRAELLTDFSVNSYSTELSDRLIFQVNSINVFENPLPPPRNLRNRVIYIQRELSLNDEVNFKIPQGYYVDFLPSSFTESNQFGELIVSFEKTNDGLIYKKSLRLNKGRFDPNLYIKVRNFYLKAEAADRTKIVVKKL